MDGRVNNGAKKGENRGQGRKPKADEMKAKELAISAIEEVYGSLEEGMIAMLRSLDTTMKKFVFEHALGKPREKVDVDLEDHTPVVINETKTYLHLNGANGKTNASN